MLCGAVRPGGRLARPRGCLGGTNQGRCQEGLGCCCLCLLGRHGRHADRPLLGQRLGAALALLLEALHQQLVVVGGLWVGCK